MDWLLSNEFHRRALAVARMMGGPDWAYRYFVGDADVLDAVGRSWALFSALERLPENEPPLTASQLVAVVNSLFKK